MNIEKYRTYKVQDFLEDEHFRAWVYHPTGRMEQEWKVVQQHFPEQKENIKEARLLLQQMAHYFQASERQANTPDEAFRRALIARMEHAKARRKRKALQRRLIRRVSIAATVALVLGLAAWLFLFSPGQMQVYATGYGEWETIELPDGTVVELNSNSELRLAKVWEPGEDRRVWLQGEAFFRVTKDPQGARFFVLTDELAVKVLGTAFNVHSRGRETEVFLEEGKVALELEKEEKEMKPGELVVYSAKKKAITEYRTAPAELHTSWKDGSLIMKDKTVAEILEKIEEIYGLEAVVENEVLLKQHKTIAIPMDRIEVAEPILERTLEVDIDIADGHLIIQ